jgi:hypothetical protein
MKSLGQGFSCKLRPQGMPGYLAIQLALNEFIDECSEILVSFQLLSIRFP